MFLVDHPLDGAQCSLVRLHPFGTIRPFVTPSALSHLHIHLNVLSKWLSVQCGCAFSSRSFLILKSVDSAQTKCVLLSDVTSLYTK